MPTTYKILGQLTGSNSNQNLYTVPSGKQAVTSTLVVANRSAVSGSYRIMAIPSGSTLTSASYLAFDVGIGGYDTSAFTLGLTFNQGDKLDVYGLPTGSFNLFGSEIS